MSDDLPASGFSGAQLDALRAPLLRENVSTRQQAGRTLSYIEGWHAIAEANRIFGFGAWDRETVECRQVVERATKMGQNKDRDGWRVSYVGKVRITVRAGDTVIVREGTGYGSGIDADLGEAHESAVKECETDAMKRALMTFGNPFGLALYDKEQAEVEPASAPRRASQRQAPVTDRRTAAIRAAPLKDRIKAALQAAKTPKLIDEIIDINGADLAEIKQLHEPFYDGLMTLATARKTEMYGATG